MGQRDGGAHQVPLLICVTPFDEQQRSGDKREQASRGLAAPARLRFLGASRPLNLGENRWKYALQAAYTHGVVEKFTFDVAADVTAYGRNDKADAAGHDLTQQPTMQLQGFVRYAMTPAWDLRAGVSHVIDGETKLAGVSRHDEAHVTKIQLGTAAFVRTKTQLLATWGRDLKVDNGFKESSRINLRLLQLF